MGGAPGCPSNCLRRLLEPFQCMHESASMSRKFLFRGTQRRSLKRRQAALHYQVCRPGTWASPGVWHEQVHIAR